METDNSLVNKHVTDCLFCVEVSREPRKQPGASSIFKLDVEGERDKMNPNKSEQGRESRTQGSQRPGG